MIGIIGVLLYADVVMEVCPSCKNTVYRKQTHCVFCGAELPPLPPPIIAAIPAPSKNESAEFPFPPFATSYYCPICRKMSLLWNAKHFNFWSKAGRFECLNPKCKVTGRTYDDLRKGQRTPRTISVVAFICLLVIIVVIVVLSQV